MNKSTQWHDGLSKRKARSGTEKEEEKRQQGCVVSYLWEPEKLQVKFACSLAERRCRATVVFWREWGEILEERGLLVVVPFDGATG